MLDPMANGKRDGKGEQRSKRPYEKPELTVIEFTADEVMAVGCKSGPWCVLPAPLWAKTVFL